MLKKFSNAGYQSKVTIKYGETLFVKYNLIKIIPIKKDNKYVPPSPKKDLLNKLNIMKEIKIKKIIKILLKSKDILFSNERIIKIISREKKYPEHCIFVPSMKFDPLINIKMQKQVKISEIISYLSKIRSIEVILISFTSK